MHVFSKVLIANRGEIAVRVAKSIQALGGRVVAIYSDADADALHVETADQAVCVGPAPVGESYLAADKVIEAAKMTGAEAIHPGYGFLSENAAFARAVDDAGLVFIGPPAEAIELMGDKRQSNIAMKAAGVPCVPGYDGGDQSDDVLTKEADKVGYPVMVKASAGGGGRGMRCVTDPKLFREQVAIARAEAENAFGDGRLILERALLGARHVEVQVFADKFGNVIHLGERDCSVQRRHQKVIEECPSPAVNAELRAKMGQAAVEAARACNYVGAGTVEFLLDKDGAFYFLEMNTRLQVEHPVTEMVTGVDLVEWQLRVAGGEALPLKQEEVTWTGHAIEARLYAEDPAQDFLPQTGTARLWHVPEKPGCRVDHGLMEGGTVSPHYDPMVGKAIAHGATRALALRRLDALLADTILLGVPTNKAFLRSVLAHQAFASGEADTNFIATHMGDDPTLSKSEPPSTVLALAGALLFARSVPDPDDRLVGWHSVAQSPITYTLRSGEDHTVRLTASGHGLPMHVSVQSGDDKHDIELLDVFEDAVVFIHQGVRQEAAYVYEDDDLFIDSDLHPAAFHLEDITLQPASASQGVGDGQMLAPMDGVVISTSVEVGARVEPGQTVAVVEAMKMQHQIQSDVTGTVKEVSASAGQQVKLRQLLVLIEPDSPDNPETSDTTTTANATPAE
jgi:geranyl-CoA carboxylase alpha subunit